MGWNKNTLMLLFEYKSMMSQWIYLSTYLYLSFSPLFLSCILFLVFLKKENIICYLRPSLMMKRESNGAVTCNRDIAVIGELRLEEKI
jgi:hypothetical protein